MLRALVIAACLAVTLATAAPATAADPAWLVEAKAQAARDGYAIIDAATLVRLLEGPAPPLVLDVRPDYEWREGHIPGSLNLEFTPGEAMTIHPEKRAALSALLGPDRQRPIVVLCRDFRCLRSIHAARWAARAGYLSVMRCPDGYRGWRDLGGDTK